MSEAVQAPSEDAPKKKKKGMLVPLLAAVVLGGAGFASTYLGFWSPGDMLSKAPAAEMHAEPQAVFVEVPRIALNIPGGRGRTLALTAAIETDTAHAADVQHLMPRVLDAFTGFLSAIDPAAYDKRGVLEIIRGELVTRTRYVLGDQPVKDLLITEFLIQ